MTEAALRAEFIGLPAQKILVVARVPRQFDGRCVLVCPPFAEEMNKSRRMLTLFGQALNAQGIGMIVPDLFGTGDSDGDLADATWDRWLDDLAVTERWIEGQGWRVDSLVGIRLGCALVAQYARDRSSASRRAVLWQPVIDGARMLDQFLRLRVAASLMSDVKETVADLKAKMDAGAVEIAGYWISKELAAGLGSLKLATLGSKQLEQVLWCEVVRESEAPIPTPAQQTIDRWRQCETTVDVGAIVGEPFWASTEIVCVPEVIARSVDFLSARVPL